MRVRRPFLAASLTLLVPIMLTACAGQDQQGSAVHRMSEWVKGSAVGEDIGTLIADNARVPMDVPNGTGAVHAACGTLLVDAQKANGELPSPDFQVTDLLTRAYSLEGTAGNDCYNAGATNKTLLTTSLQDGIKAQALFIQALERIAAIDGRTVSTTTTTDNSTGSIFG